MSKGTRLLAALSCLLVAFASHAAALSFEITRVADGATAVPGGTGTFHDLFPPVISGRSVAFAAFTNSGLGVYLFDGGALRRVADTSTAIPDGTGLFTAFNTELLAMGEGKLVFVGLGDSGQQGMYLFDGSAIVRVIDLATPIPNGTGAFTGFGRPAVAEGKVIFIGFGEGGQQGIYLFDAGTLNRIVDTSTPIPNGTGTFTGFNSPSLHPPALSGSKIAFEGHSGFAQHGIYLFDGVSLTRVADQNTPIPHGSGNFLGFSDPLLSGDVLAFSAFGGAGQSGIFLFDGGSLLAVADHHTAVPDGTGNFGAIGPPAFAGALAFYGSSAQTLLAGVYLFDQGSLTRVADTNTPIPNGTGTFNFNLPLLPEPLVSPGNVAFVGSGKTDQPVQAGIYLFDGVSLNRVVDLQTPIPGAAGSFQNFRLPALSGQNVVFLQLFPLGIYLATPALPPRANVRLGLRSSDDVGTAFDLKVEVLKNATTLVASGVTRCIRGLARNPSTAAEIETVLDPPGTLAIGAGDLLSLRLSARIGSNPDDSRCSGVGASHVSAAGLRMYYDAVGQASRFAATIRGADERLFLHSDGGACASAESAAVTTRFLDPTPPTATGARCKDSGIVRFAGGNPWSEIGTWSMVVPP